MTQTRREWIAQGLRRRKGGREGMECALLERYENCYGHPFVPASSSGEARGLAERLFDQMLRANRDADTSLAPYVDKLAVRKFVAATVGAEHLVPMVWSGRNALAIPVKNIPLPAILKPTHLSQKVMVLTGDSNPAAVRRRAFRWLLSNHYWTGGEYQYRAIRPGLMIEELLDDGTDHGPMDYSFWCFHGEPAFVQTRDNLRTHHDAYDLDWHRMDLFVTPLRDISLPRPAGLDTMIRIARRLSAQFPFVRVDLYDVRGHVYVGELTFTPGAGYTRLKDPAVDRLAGAAMTREPSAMADLREYLKTCRLERQEHENR